MATWSVRCRHNACRHRRVINKHPDDYKVVPKCPKCGQRKGWRVEARAYNQRQLCHCSGPDMVATGAAQHFPHRVTHPYCDHHPLGFYNQARARGVAHEDIPAAYGGGKVDDGQGTSDPGTEVSQGQLQAAPGIHATQHETHSS